jgi:hypothetical protein
LKKAVYSAKQGGRVWYENIRKQLLTMGYMPLQADHAVFICICGENFSVLVLYVDDITIATNSMEDFLKDKEDLDKYYQMTHLSNIS